MIANEGYRKSLFDDSFEIHAFFEEKDERLVLDNSGDVIDSLFLLCTEETVHFNHSLGLLVLVLIGDGGSKGE